MSNAPPICAILGYGPGLGAAIATRFAAGGYRVHGLARDPSRHTASGIALRAADAADPASLTAALDAPGVGPVDVLICNAYRATMAQPGPSALPLADLAADFAVNVGGALAAAQAVLPGMRAAGRGSILFTGGGLALDPTGWLPAASLAIGKAGLRSLAQTLHAELAPAGIHAGTVTVAGMIAPGTAPPGTAFHPARIAEAFWSLHQDPPGAFRAEIIFQG